MCSYKHTHNSAVHTEPITLVGHSHGGNVMIEAANILKRDYGITVDNIITVNTPSIKAHQLGKLIKNDINHYQIYNSSDLIQPNGGSLYNIEDSNDKTTNTGSKLMDEYSKGEDMMTGEMGPADVTFKSAKNILYKHKTGISDKDYGSHMGNWRKNVKEWLPLLKQTVKQVE